MRFVPLINSGYAAIFADPGEFAILGAAGHCACRELLFAMPAILDADGAAVPASESVKIAGSRALAPILAINADCHHSPFVSRLGLGDGGLA